MNSRQRTPGLLTAVATAVLILVPVAPDAQSANGGASRPWTSPRTPDGQPDLQGVWIDTSATPLERPKAFEGRAHMTDEEFRRLRERADRLFDDSRNDAIAGDNLFLALLADRDIVDNPNSTHSSHDMIRREVDTRTSLIIDPPDGRLPALTTEGMQRRSAGQASTLAIPWQPGLDAATEQRQAADAAKRPPPAGPEDLSNFLRCITWGVPKIAGNATYTSHYQIVQSPGYVVLLNEVNHEARIIPLDGRPHLPQDLRQWNGDSRGRWDGNTLVIETTNFSPKSFFMGSTANLRLTERFTRINADTINYELIISDPTTWTAPWTALIRLKQSQERLYESACHEGNYHIVAGILAGARAEDQARRGTKIDGSR
jgi:hypothetical protein